MTTIITRLFPSLDQAAAAAASLNLHGLRPEEINLVRGDSASMAADIGRGGVSKAQAAAYARQIADGGALVTAHARFGLAAGAMKILDAHGAVAGGDARGEHFARQEMDPTPLSHFLDIPTLSKNPTPFASFFNLWSLTRNATPLSSLLSLPTISRKKAFLTFGKLQSGPVFGMEQISRSPTPLSSALGLPTISHKAERRY